MTDNQPVIEALEALLAAVQRLDTRVEAIEQRLQHHVEVAPAGFDAPVKAILQATATYYGVEVEALLGGYRARNLVRARHVAWWLLRNLTDLSYPQIGEIFGRDHTTIVRGVQTMAQDGKSLSQAIYLAGIIRKEPESDDEGREGDSK